MTDLSNQQQSEEAPENEKAADAPSSRSLSNAHDNPASDTPEKAEGVEVEEDSDGKTARSKSQTAITMAALGARLRYTHWTKHGADSDLSWPAFSPHLTR